MYSETYFSNIDKTPRYLEQHFCSQAEKETRKQLFAKVKTPKEGTIIKFKTNSAEINSF